MQNAAPEQMTSLSAKSRSESSGENSYKVLGVRFRANNVKAWRVLYPKQLRLGCVTVCAAHKLKNRFLKSVSQTPEKT